MKLLYCNKCEDIIRLTKVEKTCDCGETKGKYINDIEVEYEGNCEKLAINNFKMNIALQNKTEFDCYVIGENEKYIRKG